MCCYICLSEYNRKKFLSGITGTNPGPKTPIVFGKYTFFLIALCETRQQHLVGFVAG
jgi:hypothetical protein